MPRKKTNAGDAKDLVQFRPGANFGSQLDHLAKTWILSRHEVAKRLALLAAHGFHVADYGPIAELATILGGTLEFGVACQLLQATIYGASRAGGDSAYDQLGRAAKVAFLRRAASDLVAARGGHSPLPDDAHEPPEESSESHELVVMGREIELGSRPIDQPSPAVEGEKTK
jgi:hypothetical protein